MSEWQTAQLLWDHNGQPISAEFDDIYFSKASGIEESHHVFIEHNQLLSRWQALEPNAVFTVCETGFGTGLNCLLAAQLWLQHAPPNAQLHLVSIEKYPLNKHDLHTALELWPTLSPVSASLLRDYRIHGPGFYRLHLTANVHLTLIIDDVRPALETLLCHPAPGKNLSQLKTYWTAFDGGLGKVDAWFLDGFAPAKNPDMWTDALYTRMARLSHNNTTFATFTAAGSVRRGLAAAGFQVHKVAGFGRKREMLHGHFEPSQSQLTPQHKPSPSWHLQVVNLPKPKTVAIIGAGLAGAHSAYKLAQAGFSVTVFEQAYIGAGASGNPQGALYTKLSPTHGTQGEFNLATYAYACRFYHQTGLFDLASSQCGLLQLALKPAQIDTYQAIAHRFPELCQWQNPNEASTTAGIDLSAPGLFFPHSGWLQPAKVCEWLLQQAQISVRDSQKVHALALADSWQLLDKNHQTLGEFDAVVIACAHSAQNFSQCAMMPINAIRGQVTNSQATASSTALKTVLCGEGYIAPAHERKHCLGATFTLNNSNSSPEPVDEQINLHNAKSLSPAFSALASRTHDARVSFRCTTPDYLPVIGPVPIAADMIQRYAKYRQNFKFPIDAPGSYWPGLFINIGHGSRGLTYTPLAAELLTSLMLGAPLPISRDMALNTHPARFLMRDLARNRL